MLHTSKSPLKSTTAPANPVRKGSKQRTLEAILRAVTTLAIAVIIAIDTTTASTAATGTTTTTLTAAVASAINVPCAVVLAPVCADTASRTAAVKHKPSLFLSLGSMDPRKGMLAGYTSILFISGCHGL